MNPASSSLIRLKLTGLLALAGGVTPNLFAQVTNAPLTAPPFPEAGVSLLRVTGALALVLGLFLGGVWLYKNWQRLACQRQHQPRLNILETRSLGPRQAIFVVAYEQQRFLISTSPAGINLLTHLPDGEAPLPGAETPGAPVPFAQALAQVLKRK
jgi:flagellar biogenesis protein FliO